MTPMPPCPQCGQTTTDEYDWHYCAKCELRFRFEEGGGFIFLGNAETATDIKKDWPYFWDTAKWRGIRPEDSITTHIIRMDLPQFAGTRRPVG